MKKLLAVCRWPASQIERAEGTKGVPLRDAGLPGSSNGHRLAALQISRRLQQWKKDGRINSAAELFHGALQTLQQINCNTLILNRKSGRLTLRQAKTLQFRMHHLEERVWLGKLHLALLDAKQAAEDPYKAYPEEAELSRTARGRAG